METTRGGSLTDRMMGAAKLDVNVYEEVEADTTATAQAGLVVMIVAVASAIGAASGGVFAAIAGMIAAILGWLLWAGVSYLVNVPAIMRPHDCADTFFGRL